MFQLRIISILSVIANVLVFRTALPESQNLSPIEIFDSSENIVINWSVFTPEDFMNVNFSRTLIQCLPVVQYWDVLKGSFRSAGLIGEKVNFSVSEVLDSGHTQVFGLRGLVSQIEKKVVVRGKARKMQTDVVELPMVFMHAVNAVKDIALIYDVLKVQVQNRGTPGEIQKKKEFFLSRFEPDWIKPSEVLFRSNLTALKLQELSYRQEIEILSRKQLQDRTNFKINSSRAEILKVHERLLDSIKLHNEVIKELHKERLQYLRNIHLQEDNATVLEQISVSQKELHLDITLLKENEKYLFYILLFLLFVKKYIFCLINSA